MEPLKIWGHVEKRPYCECRLPSITTQCLRVPVSDGHTAAVFASFEKKPELEEIKKIWAGIRRRGPKAGASFSSKQFLHYFEENDRPQPRLDRDLEAYGCFNRSAAPDSQYDIKFVCLSHNTLRGAAGGAVLMAELWLLRATSTN